jgi:hypothetical protein
MPSIGIGIRIAAADRFWAGMIDFKIDSNPDADADSKILRLWQSE